MTVNNAHVTVLCIEFVKMVSQVLLHDVKHREQLRSSDFLLINFIYNVTKVYHPPIVTTIAVVVLKLALWKCSCLLQVRELRLLTDSLLDLV
jgi:hypothetical protein